MDPEDDQDLLVLEEMRWENLVRTTHCNCSPDGDGPPCPHGNFESWPRTTWADLVKEDLKDWKYEGDEEAEDEEEEESYAEYDDEQEASEEEPEGDPDDEEEEVENTIVNKDARDFEPILEEGGEDSEAVWYMDEEGNWHTR